MIKHIRKYLLSLFALLLASCNLNVHEPVDLVWDKAAEKTDQLIIFLPGLYDTADKFKEEDFFAKARKSGIKADMVSANINVLHLVEEMMIKRIETDIFDTARKNGYKNIWLVGVSIGGLNSLLFYRKYADALCGVVTIAPFVANKPLIKELTDAKNIENWTPGSANKNLVFEKKLNDLWLWLKEQKAKNKLNHVYLGYGKQDKYIEAITLLRNVLNEKNVVVVEGKHDWETGRRIWQQQLSLRAKNGLLKPCN